MSSLPAKQIEAGEFSLLSLQMGRGNVGCQVCGGFCGAAEWLLSADDGSRDAKWHVRPPLAPACFIGGGGGGGGDRDLTLGASDGAPKC